MKRERTGRSSGAAYLFSLPALAFLGLFFLLPIVILAGRSFVEIAPDGSWTFTLAVYRALFSDPYNLGLIWRTLKLSAITTAVSLVIAFPVALHLRQLSSRWKSLITFAVLSPLLTSVVVRTLAWVILLGPQGLVNSSLASLGLGTLPLMYNEFGVVVGLTHVFLGYMVLALMTSVAKIDQNLLLAASNLGAGRWAVLRRIILPLSLPGMLAGCILVFTMAASTYATPVLLGGSSAKVLAAEVYDLAINYIDFAAAAGVAVVLFVLSAGVVYGGTRFVEGGRRRVIFP